MAKNQRKVGIIISYAGQLVHILTGLLYTPVMLRLLGQSEYGLYQLVYSVVSYLSLLSLGFGASYMRFYAREKAKDDEIGIAKMNGMFMLIFGTISLICLLCGIVMLKNIRFIFGKGLTEMEYATARVLMSLMIINLALTFPNSVFNCIITSQERFIFQKTLSLLQYILSPFLTLPLLLMGYGSIGMVTVTTLLTVAVFVSNIYYCLKKLKAKFYFRGLHFSLLKEMWVFTFFIFLNQIIDQINLNIDKYLLGRLSGTVTVAVYGVSSQINTMYMSLSASVSNVFVPKVNRIVAEKRDDAELTKIFIKTGRVQFMILSLVLSGFICYGKAFVRLWAGEGYDASYYVALLLLIPITVPMIQNIGIEIQRAKNKHKARSVVYFLMALVNVGLSIPLIKTYGAIGATIGTAISLFFGNFLFMNWYYYTRIGIDIIAFWKNIITFIPALIIAGFFGIISGYLFMFDNFIKLGIGIAIYAIIYSGLLYMLVMNKEEKALITGTFNKVLRK